MQSPNIWSRSNLGRQYGYGPEDPECRLCSSACENLGQSGTPQALGDIAGFYVSMESNIVKGGRHPSFARASQEGQDSGVELQ